MLSSTPHQKYPNPKRYSYRFNKKGLISSSEQLRSICAQNNLCNKSCQGRKLTKGFKLKIDPRLFASYNAETVLKNSGAKVILRFDQKNSEQVYMIIYNNSGRDLYQHHLIPGQADYTFGNINQL